MWPKVARAHTEDKGSQRTGVLEFGYAAMLFAVERVTGIEPALSAWEEFLSHRVPLSCNGFGGLT